MGENIQNIQKQPEHPDLVALYRDFLENKKHEEQCNGIKITELFQTGKNEFTSEDGMILSAINEGKQMMVALTSTDEKIKKCDDTGMSIKKSYGQAGYVGKLPEGMDCLADDPQHVVDNLVNDINPFGRKFVVSKRKK